MMLIHPVHVTPAIFFQRRLSPSSSSSYLILILNQLLYAMEALISSSSATITSSSSPFSIFSPRKTLPLRPVQLPLASKGKFFLFRSFWLPINHQNFESFDRPSEDFKFVFHFPINQTKKFRIIINLMDLIYLLAFKFRFQETRTNPIQVRIPKTSKTFQFLVIAISPSHHSPRYSIQISQAGFFFPFFFT